MGSRLDVSGGGAGVTCHELTLPQVAVAVAASHLCDTRGTITVQGIAVSLTGKIRQHFAWALQVRHKSGGRAGSGQTLAGVRCIAPRACGPRSRAGGAICMGTAVTTCEDGALQICHGWAGAAQGGDGRVALLCGIAPSAGIGGELFSTSSARGQAGAGAGTSRNGRQSWNWWKSSVGTLRVNKGTVGAAQGPEGGVTDVSRFAPTAPGIGAGLTVLVRTARSIRGAARSSEPNA